MKTPRFLESFDEPSLHTEINMIPFIDIMLVLLVIFMVTVPAYYQHVPFELPQVSASKSTAVKGQRIHIALTDEGKFLFNGAVLSIDTLEKKLLSVVDKNTPIDVAIARGVRYETFVRLIQLLQSKAFTQLHLQTQPE